MTFIPLDSPPQSKSPDVPLPTVATARLLIAQLRRAMRPAPKSPQAILDARMRRAAARRAVDSLLR